MSIDLLISRLQKPRKAPARNAIARAYRAHCPHCDGHGLPLSIAETADGRVLMHCFTGCEPENILSAVGLTFSDILPDRPKFHRKTPSGSPEKWAGIFSALDALFSAHAEILAICSPYIADAAEREKAVAAVLRAGELMQKIQSMARILVRECGGEE